MLEAEEAVGAPDNNTLTILQSVLLPNESRAARTRLYANFCDGEVRLDQGLGLPVQAKSDIDFCTFFNAFSHRKWIDLTGLDDLSLRLHGTGKIEVTVAMYVITGAAWEIVRQDIDLSPAGVIVPLPPLSSLAGELLGFRVNGGFGGSVVTAISWVTRERPRRDISLAAVITTFGREEAVTRAMASFSNVTCATPPLGHLELYVVDNERRLPPSTAASVTIFPNPNLGGSGGFARGLKEARAAGKFTHVLFMDDDAACEPESVWRSMSLLAYVKNTNAAIAGAMLLSSNPCIQYEKGGAYDRTGRSGLTWFANHHNVDVSDIFRICQNEAENQINYGAWWFFAFPLASVKFMPFPFFVRGDDVDFSLSNEFQVVTLNGVATWCDSFGTKLGPGTEYLAYRGWMTIALMHGTRNAAFLALWNGLKTAEAMALRFDYVGMNAVLDGIEDAMRGPEFFRDTPVPLEKIKALKALRPVKPPSLDEFKSFRFQTWGDKSYNRKAKWSLGGHLFRTPNKESAVRHATVAWEFNRWGLAEADKAAVGAGVHLDMLVRDRRAFLAGKLRITKILWVYRFKLEAIQQRYRTLGPLVRTQAYWDPLFEAQAPKAGRAPMAAVTADARPL